MGTFYVWIIGLPLAVVAVSALLASAFNGRRRRLITTTGRGAIGRVLTVGSDSDGLGSTSYWVKVQYDYDGETVTAKVPVSQRDQQRYRDGQRVGLTYAPSRPQVVRLDPPEWPLPQVRRSGGGAAGPRA